MVKVYKQIKTIQLSGTAFNSEEHGIVTEVKNKPSFTQMSGPFEYSTATRFSVTDNHLFVWGGNDAVASFAPGEWSHVEVE